MVQTSYAGFVSRGIAFITDLAIMSIAVLIVIALANSVTGFFTLYGLLSPGSTGSAIVAGAISLLSVGFVITYPVGFWVLFGQTPGKYIMGLRIVSVDGAPLTVRQAIRRYIGYWISAIPLFLGYLWVLVDDRRQGWHDKFARTYVLYERETRPHHAPAR